MQKKTMAVSGVVFFIFVVTVYIIMTAMSRTPPEGMDGIRQQIREESLIQ